jgi:hypothetical protein
LDLDQVETIVVMTIGEWTKPATRREDIADISCVKVGE